MGVKSKDIVILSVFVVALVFVSWFFLFYGQSGSGELDEFVRCLSEKGALFYGAFWCPHCLDQKEVFGNSAKNLPYIECSSPDGEKQLQVCQQADIQAYPTWQFSDGSRKEGFLTLQELGDASGCPLP